MAYFGAWPKAVGRLMEQRGVRSRAELARRAKIAASAVSDYLNGKQEPSVAKLELLLRAMGADYSDLHRALLEAEGVIVESRIDKSRKAAVDALHQLAKDIAELGPS